MPVKTVISAVAFQEGDAWVVQGVEYDICAHAWDPAELPAAFARALMDNIVITESLGRSPLEGIKAAPEKFRTMFERARAQVTAVGDAVTDQRLPIGSIDIRLAGPVA